MLTPQDIQNKAFAKAVFGGYDMENVDGFLEEIFEDYSSLYKENAILKSKIKVLVEKVEEYRSTEDAMRMALLTAQKMGDDLVAEAEKKSSNMLENAEEKAKEKLRSISDEIRAENEKLAAAKQSTIQYVEVANKLLDNQRAALANLSETADALNVSVAMPAAPVEEAPAQSEPSREETISDAVKEIDSFVSNMLQNESAYDDDSAPTRKFEPVAADDDDEPVTPRPKFDFSDLQFGANYKGE